VAYAPGMSALLAPLVATFRRLHPQVTVALHQRLSLAVAEAVQAGLASVGIGVMTLPGLETMVLREQPMDRLVVPPEHPLAERETLTVAELDGVPLLAVTRRSNPDFYDTFTRFFADRGVRPVFELVEISSPQEILDLVTAGVGVAVMAATSLERVS